ncbi:GNAT family N-acetyltransferase [Oxalobacter vibrioformis]|uniref:GNAT family N-acetyltransferase n=1 Tax=Oxalobacter vibrioformis TaxID=933080 RepID=A0A9E9P273_9BURK|nr:GNAT family N-acetyltransferase [Oxalobacter vibrioformis]WAW09584.1 GNAT family N-acetyltransferase [Oxalobacter vibrioformis]
MKNISPSAELETERLILRQWKRKDYAPYAELNADRVVMAFFTATFTRKESDAMVAYLQSLIARRGWGVWAVERKSDGAFIGSVGLHVPHAKLPFTPCVEVGWRLAQAYWGHGYATEAAREVLRFGFEVLALPEIVAFTSLLNTRSMAVMQRLGMVTDPGQNFPHPDVPKGSPLREHCLYRITRSEWVDAAS